MPALVGLLLAGGCAAPEVSVRGARFAAIGQREANLVFQVELSNPNSYPVSLWGLRCDLVSGGQTFARAVLTAPVTSLSAGQTDSVYVPVTVPYDRLAAALAKSPGAGRVEYELVGSADFNFILFRRAVTFRHRGRFPRLGAVSWGFSEVRTIAADGGRADLVFTVGNPNDFALPLESLRGVVTDGSSTFISVDRSDLPVVPPGETIEVVVRLSLEEQDRARLLAARASLRFEGELRLGVPDWLSDLLMSGE